MAHTRRGQLFKMERLAVRILLAYIMILSSDIYDGERVIPIPVLKRLILRDELEKSKSNI